ncbi:LysR family transcriptional regulator [Acetobacter sp. TBRC 12305]|uniref:LysR family transcriptional regulator n=1 Tax=Acetobacter garciniae TaxID=2817435 RepID=A0A939HJB0_9PROT|nr:LysR substrate-binding domain-containing protein [Acetobacter garciniae]MBO1325483.1 LysR family transcriptional regulator [Acetobacter garciniae]MBX0345345.1 LysR family transcriptional regulator [Acetobacter garciniae]
MKLPRQLPPLRLLSVFRAIARHRTLRAAARALNVSQPAVSKSLRELEQWVGAALLDRSRRPLGLTPSGEMLLAAIETSFGLLADTLDDIARLHAQRGRTLRISCSIGFATYWLMQRLSTFSVAWPDIAVSVMTTAHDAAPDAPHADVMFRYGHGRWTDGDIITLFAERIDPVASPDFVARLPPASTDLSDIALIHVDVDDASWRSWNGYLQQTGLSRRRNGADLRFNNYVQATQAALNGQGIMLGWRSITGDLVADARLRLAGLPPVMPEDGAYHIVIPPGSADNPAVAHFVSWLRQLIADEKHAFRKAE